MAIEPEDYRPITPGAAGAGVVARRMRGAEWLTQAEGETMAKIYCGHEGCGRTVRAQGDLCWQHGKAEPAQATVEPAVVEQESAGTADILPSSIRVERAQGSAGSALEKFLKPVELPTGIVVPFSQEEIVALIEAEITAENIRELVLLLLSGELRRVTSN